MCPIVARCDPSVRVGTENETSNGRLNPETALPMYDLFILGLDLFLLAVVSALAPPVYPFS